MGKRRRKLLRKKYAKLSWNKYYQNHPEKKDITEQGVTKIVEDNSVILEQMKDISNTFEEVLETFGIITEASPETTKPDPVIKMKGDLPVEMRTQPHAEPALIVPETPNFKRMTKKLLLSYAKDNNISTKSSMTKTQLIKAIQES